MLLSTTARAGPTARFDFVEYRARGAAAAPPTGQFRNPVLPGFHPDPSIVRVGDDFYLVTSTFSWFPGLPIFHSRDLVSWTLLGHAIDRPGMMDFSGLGTNRGLFAPAIAHHGGKFWIVNTCIDCRGNFVITADRPEGPWSDPVWLPFDGIDPSLFFDRDAQGKETAWIVYNDAPPGEPQYEGHRALWLQGFDPDTMKLVGERTLLVDGGVDISQRPVWAEGPHIYKIDGWYYLLAAEGGTADQHSQTIYRSRSVAGPYEPGPVNPILTQRNMDPSRPDRVEATGHADMVQLDDGSWWGVFLATRPFAGQSTLLGRETFLLPVRWDDGWPRFLDPGEAVPATVPRPALPADEGTDWSGWRDDFHGGRLSPEWITIRSPGTEQRFGVDPAAGELWVTAGPDRAGSLGRPAFTGRRLRHHAAAVTTRVSFAPARDGDFAGLLAFMDETHFFALGIEGARQGRRIVARLRDADRPDEGGAIVASQTLADSGAVELKIDLSGGTARFDWRRAGAGTWTTLAENVDVEGLASVHAGLFTGLVIGPYAVAGG
ncbi:MAG: glycoside hydrolase family 43 protein [Alphaproteobacteria bacterium]|nr:glycoside hydrolase family 43 protein [Alphaproteobacteria bacterium]